MNQRPHIAIVVSHPIQHFCPQYASFARNGNCRIKVFFGSALGYKKYVDENFKQEISWGNLRLDQFEQVFLNGEAVLPSDKDLDAPSLEKELELYQPDLVIGYGYFQKLQRRACRWAVKSKIPFAFIGDSELRHKRNVLKDLLKAVFLRRYFSGVSFCLTVGNANEAYYTRYGVPQRKLIRMHFPIDVEQYKMAWTEKQALREKIRNEYRIPENDIVVSVVGKLSPWKNQDHLIEAVRLLEAKGVYIHLFILGSGEMKAAWEQKAQGLLKSHVYFPGFVNIETLPSYYAATDIYAHPASIEPHSIAISEAIYMGCPIVVSDRCGSFGEDDDVQEGNNGFVFEFGNIEQLAGKIELLAKDQSLRERFGAHSHSISVAFQQKAHFGVLERLIEKVKKVTPIP